MTGETRGAASAAPQSLLELRTRRAGLVARQGEIDAWLALHGETLDVTAARMRGERSDVAVAIREIDRRIQAADS